MRMIYYAVLAACVASVNVLHAESVAFPADAGHQVLTAYGAEGSDTIDDTQAFKRAFALYTYSGRSATNFKTLYIPNGTYYVSDTIFWKRWVTIQGQSESGTVIRLRNNCPGYGAGAKKTVLRCLYNNNEPFANYVSNLTINTGSGNPGAIGFRYNNHNEGALRHVTIKSDDGQGMIGLDMTET